jgi:hypothetical protein
VKTKTARQIALEAVELLETAADLCDAWAGESQQGGWSTHQVDVQKRAAALYRGHAARLRKEIKEAQS